MRETLISEWAGSRRSNEKKWKTKDCFRGMSIRKTKIGKEKILPVSAEFRVGIMLKLLEEADEKKLRIF